jgi:gas vesicle protein
VLIVGSKEKEMVIGRQESEVSMGTSIVTFLLGAAVGVTVAILYAPASGETTRARIAQKASAVKDRASEWTENAVDRVGEWKSNVASGAHDALDQFADAVQTASDSIDVRSTKKS